MERLECNEYFMQMAELVAKRSACLSRQVGCVLVSSGNKVLSTGYNGPPAGVHHCVTCARKESGRNLYECHAVHAEMNALLQCPDINKIAAAYISVSPCLICTRLLMNTRCYMIKYREPYADLVRVQNLWMTGGLRKIEKV